MEFLKYKTLFLDNKYTKTYFDLISKAYNEGRILRRKTTKGYIYYHKHHILPKSLYPEFANLTEHRWNKALLTPREHYIAHALLIKMTEGNFKYKMLCAYSYMNKHYGVKNSRLFEFYDKQLRKIQSEQRKGIPVNTDYTFSEEKKKLYSEMFTGEKNPMFGRKQSEETKQKISKRHIGRKHNNICYMNDGIKNIRIQLTKQEEYEKLGFVRGKLPEGPRSEEWKRNVSISLKGKKHSEEQNTDKSRRYSGSGNPNFGKETSYETKIKMCWKQTAGLYITPWGNFISTKMAFEEYDKNPLYDFKISVGYIRYHCMQGDLGFSFKNKDNIILGVDFTL